MFIQPRRIPNSHRAGGLAHVLVVAECTELRAQLAQAISAVDGVETTHAESAHKAISIVQTRLPDVVLADVDDDVEIARGTTAQSGVAIPAGAES